MQITRSADRVHKRGPAEWFTGAVDILEIVAPSTLLVTFEPGARTAWHTHPHGQTLHIVSGVARIAREGGQVEVLNPGDRVAFAPGERHWHGAARDGGMSHLAVAQPGDDGVSASWQEPVSDAEYGA